MDEAWTNQFLSRAARRCPAAMMPRASCGNGAKSNFIDHFELLREQAKVSVTCSVPCPLLADWPQTPRPPQSEYPLGQSARPIARGPVDSLAPGGLV